MSRLRDAGIRLRHRMTEEEVILWSGLKGFRDMGAKFRRQVPLGDYVVDFACHRSKVVIELDGIQHAEDGHAERDRIRDDWLASRGYKVLRFWNRELWPYSGKVLDVIAQEVQSRLPSP